VRPLAALLVFAVAGCQAAPSLEEARLASSSPEILSCAEWFQALDREVREAGVRDLEYLPVPGFPYLRSDPFLARARASASRSPAAFAALVDRLAEHDLESRRYEIDNLPAAVVKKWGGMSLDDSRSTALRRSAQCGRLLRDVELVRPDLRAALLERAIVDPASRPGEACRTSAGAAGAVVRYAPPPASPARDAVAAWLLRAQADPLGQPLVSARELAAMAAAYAPSLEVVVASDGDRFGALRWRPGVGRLEIDASEPAVYVGRSYARYGEHVLLQILYTVLFPENRIAWRVTLAPDGEPLLYDAVGADGCRVLVLTPRARARGDSRFEPARLPRIREGERPLVAVSATAHELRPLGLVRGSDSLARYTIRSYDELRSAPTLEGRNRAAAGQPVPVSEPLGASFVFDLREPRP
jgi:hypothetical protein